MIYSQTEEIIGEVSIKHAYTENIINYRGNIGFTVFERYRGKKYSSRSCILLKPVLKYLSINPVWITCNIDNLSSKKNIELLGAKFFDKVIINDDSPFAQYYAEDSRIKLRYKWEIE